MRLEFHQQETYVSLFNAISKFQKTKSTFYQKKKKTNPLQVEEMVDILNHNTYVAFIFYYERVQEFPDGPCENDLIFHFQQFNNTKLLGYFSVNVILVYLKHRQSFSFLFQLYQIHSNFNYTDIAISYFRSTILILRPVTFFWFLVNSKKV